MNCEECGKEMREEVNPLGFAPEGELPPPMRVYTCMNEKCEMFNYPQKMERP
jgi:hypothetical protein